MGKFDIADFANWEKIFDAAKEEPLPVLATQVWAIGKILDVRLKELIQQNKTIEGILQDIQFDLAKKN